MEKRNYWSSFSTANDNLKRQHLFKKNPIILNIAFKAKKALQIICSAGNSSLKEILSSSVNYYNSFEPVPYF